MCEDGEMEEELPSLAMNDWVGVCCNSASGVYFLYGSKVKIGNSG